MSRNYKVPGKKLLPADSYLRSMGMTVREAKREAAIEKHICAHEEPVDRMYGMSARRRKRIMLAHENNALRFDLGRREAYVLWKILTDEDRAWRAERDAEMYGWAAP